MITSTLQSSLLYYMGCPFKNKILSGPHRGGTDMIPSYLPYNILSQVNANIFQNISTYTLYYLRTCVVYSNLICLHFIIQNSNLAIFSFSLFSQIIFIMGHFQQAHTTHSMYRFCCGIKPGKSARRAAF